MYAVFAENSLKTGKKDAAYGPHEVATKSPNAWGLYDMSGNVAEWTRDNYFAITFSIEKSNPQGSFWGTSKVLKGGSWKDKVKKLNMTVRDDEDPRYWSDWIGFRCVFPLTADPAGQVQFYIDWQDFTGSRTGRCVARCDGLPDGVIDYVIACIANAFG